MPEIASNDPRQAKKRERTLNIK